MIARTNVAKETQRCMISMIAAGFYFSNRTLHATTQSRLEGAGPARSSGRRCRRAGCYSGQRSGKTACRGARRTNGRNSRSGPRSLMRISAERHAGARGFGPGRQLFMAIRDPLPRLRPSFRAVRVRSRRSRRAPRPLSLGRQHRHRSWHRLSPRHRSEQCRVLRYRIALWARR